MLLDFVRRLDRFREGRRGVHLHLSRLRPYNRRHHHLRIAATTFDSLIPRFDGSLFRMQNGDCEDYAIAKFMALRALGFENPEMRIVVLNDLNLGIAHAILVVYVDGKALVLDNQIRSVVPADSIRHYQPVYSVNEEGWWLHRP